jgi:hypothetical protein
MALFKLPNLKQTTKKASNAADKLSKFIQKPGNPIPWVLNPNYKQIVKPATPASKPAPKKKGLLDSLGDNLRSAGRAIDKAVTQPIAKEIKHIVQPVAGEVAMRAKDLANSKAVKQAGDAIGDGLRSFDKNVIQPVSTSKALKTIQGKAQQAADYVGDEVRNIPGSLKNMAQASQDPERRGSFLPLFTKKIPDAVGDVIRGTARMGEGLVTADGGQIMSGLKTLGRGTWDGVKHTGLGTAEVLGRMFGQGPSGSYTQGAGKGGTQEQREAEEAARNKGVVPQTPEQKETLDKLKEYGADAWDYFKDAMRTVYEEGIKPGFDNIEVKTARSRYGDVARPEEIEVFRRAERAGDEKLKDILKAQWQYRQKFPGRDYSEDFMNGTVYQK